MTTRLFAPCCGRTLAGWVAAAAAATALASAPSQPPLRIAPRADSAAAGLDVSHPDLPGNTFDFRTCEAVLDGARHYGLFRVKLGLPGSTHATAWSRTRRGFAYEWAYPEGILVRCEAVSGAGRVAVTYTVVNRTAAPLARVHLHTCVTTTGTPAFFPLLAPRSQSQLPADSRDQDYTELLARLFVWSGGRSMRLDRTEYGRREVHLSLMPRGHAPIQWAWWVNAAPTFDEPLIALVSRDGRWTAGLQFERAAWASSNTGDNRACFHLFPAFGRIEPGASATTRGAFHLIRGSPEEFRRRARGSIPSTPK